MAGDALRIFPVDHPAVARTLGAKLAKRRSEFAEQIALGNAEDFPDYRERVGFIRGLKEAIDLCEAVEREHQRG